MFVDLVTEPVEPALVILDSSEQPESETMRGEEDSENPETEISSAGEIKYLLS